MNTILSKLQSQIQALQFHRNAVDADIIHSQCSAVDRMMPEAGYARGTLVDWIAPSGCAADFLSLSVASAACENGGALVVIDPGRQFFPAAAAAMGINMQNLIVLRSAEKPAGHIRAIGQDLLWAIDQSLRCPAVAAVWGPLPKINDRWQRRFQLSAESSGSIGLFVRPLSVARQPSWSEVQWLVSPNTASIEHENDFSVRLNLVRCRGTHGSKSILVSINTVTGSVQKARSDREHTQHPHPSIQRPISESSGTSAKRCQTHPLPVVAGVAHSAIGRSGT